MIREFVDETGSTWGQTVLNDFGDLLGRFWLIKPTAANIETLLDTLLQAA
jgi:glutamate synthase (NADPH/NADH) large chain